MTPELKSRGADIKPSDYPASKGGFRRYLHDLGDELFPFPDYREYQDEILYETLDAMFIDGYRNVIVEGPTGIGKSPYGVAMGRAVSELYAVQSEINDHFGISIRGLREGNSFYTTPQKSLRNQLAEDDDLQEYVSMLKGRRDYICRETGDNCQECSIRADSDHSCRKKSGCTYWRAKAKAMQSDIAITTFAMLIVDNYVPPQDQQGNPLSFRDRDLVIVDEGHGSEGQSASLFAGFTLSPWTMPPEVYDDAGELADWNDDRLKHVRGLISEIKERASDYVDMYEDADTKQAEVEKCEDVLRKIGYCFQTAEQGRGWVVNINKVSERGMNPGTTKAIEVKPVRVDDFLSDFVWSRGRRRLIASATIPFRGNPGKWAERIGLDEEVKFIPKPTPFPKEHRQIHMNTTVGEMSGDDEDINWSAAMDAIREISSHHEGEKGLIHSVSYPRAERVGESLGDNVMVHEDDQDSDAVLQNWQNSDKDILVSPTMTQGVDLFFDRCRWQVLLKVPYAYIGDSRVSYLLNEENDWQWYMEEAAMDIIQAVGRAVRGPEPGEAASFYVLDEKFDEVMGRTNPPDYFVEAITDDAPEHWDDPSAAPWRGIES